MGAFDSCSPSASSSASSGAAYAPSSSPSSCGARSSFGGEYSGSSGAAKPSSSATSSSRNGEGTPFLPIVNVSLITPPGLLPGSLPQPAADQRHPVRVQVDGLVAAQHHPACG